MVYSPGEISDTINMMENSESIYKIFPNPVKNNVNINMMDTLEANIFIFNSIGGLVYQNTFSDKINIDKKEIGANGIYLLKISTPDANYFDKVVIQ
jgi:hypothetical protein